jgi:hypothetical protein
MGVVAVCREKSVAKLAEFEGRINMPGATDDREVIKAGGRGLGRVLVVLVPLRVHGYSSGTVQAVFYSWRVKALVNVAGRLARLARMVDLDDQVVACRRIFASDTRWIVVRGSDLEEGESQSLHVHGGADRRRSTCSRPQPLSRRTPHRAIAAPSLDLRVPPL